MNVIYSIWILPVNILRYKSEVVMLYNIIILQSTKKM